MKANAQWWYLSFASTDQFLGATAVMGSDEMDAISNSIQLGLNPGGEVLAIPLDDEVPTELRNALITSKSELENIGYG